MPDRSFEELLAELDIEEEKDSEREPEPKGNQAFTQLRDAYKRREKENEKLSKQLEEYRTKERTSALAAAGLTERQASVFQKAYDEATPENISSFKNDVLGMKLEVAPEDSESPQGAQAPNAQSFAPSAGGEPPGSKVYEFKEWQEIMKQDPTTGRALASAGKVKWTYIAPKDITQG